MISSAAEIGLRKENEIGGVFPFVLELGGYGDDGFLVVSNR